MNKNVLLAFMCWAVDCDRLTYTPNAAWELFCKDARNMLATYTDPTDEILYLEEVARDYASKIITAEEIFADYVLCYAKMGVISGVRDYSSLNKSVIQYTHSKHK